MTVELCGVCGGASSASVEFVGLGIFKGREREGNVGLLFHYLRIHWLISSLCPDREQALSLTVSDGFHELLPMVVSQLFSRLQILVEAAASCSQ